MGKKDKTKKVDAAEKKPAIEASQKSWRELRTKEEPVEATSFSFTFDGGASEEPTSPIVPSAPAKNNLEIAKLIARGLGSKSLETTHSDHDASASSTSDDASRPALNNVEIARLLAKGINPATYTGSLEDKKSRFNDRHKDREEGHPRDHRDHDAHRNQGYKDDLSHLSTSLERLEGESHKAHRRRLFKLNLLPQKKPGVKATKPATRAKAPEVKREERKREEKQTEDDSFGRKRHREGEEQTEETSSFKRPRSAPASVANEREEKTTEFGTPADSREERTRGTETSTDSRERRERQTPDRKRTRDTDAHETNPSKRHRREAEPAEEPRPCRPNALPFFSGTSLKREDWAHVVRMYSQVVGNKATGAEKTREKMSQMLEKVKEAKRAKYNQIVKARDEQKNATKKKPSSSMRGKARISRMQPRQ
ncbi:zinc finger CCCH domain-containing protein 13 [Planoprotostelium fungivorum]|uniref:Zinc finger CCCH domain-containing protein 13 n=1 Tax=Planoprotostelium fungivorum TaxID=1890364 RepID=A0A2P6NFP1_9EUKA|nr:zinc finger CCCH domain-containing protein 13 [Planoprotostelium fungivorum]